MKIVRPVQVTPNGSFTRASTATYFDKQGVMQTAIANALRVSYDPCNLAKPPFTMYEGTATNQLMYSEKFDTPPWTLTAATVTVNATTAPTGLTTAYKLVESSSEGQHHVSVPRTGVNETVTLSVYVKPAERTAFYMCMSNASSLSCGAYFDLVTDTVVSVDAANADFSAPVAKIIKQSNGWFRCSLTVTKGSANASNFPRFHTAILDNLGAGAVTYSGDGVSGLYVWGAQLESGSTATSYIPTTASQVTRSADVLSGTGLLYSNITETDYAAWSSTTAYASGDMVLDAPNHKLYQATTGLRNTITIPASSTVFTMVDANNAAIVPPAGTAVKLSTTGTLPSGFVAGTTYYVVSPTTTAFSLSASNGGAAIASGTAGTGTYTLTTQVNVGKPLNDTTNWLLAGYDNRWNMFDQSVTSQSVNANEIIVAIYPGVRFDSVVGVNVAANKATITMTDTTTGKVVYSATVKTVSNSAINSWYSYFNEPVAQIPDFIAGNLPVGISSSCILTVRLSVSSGNTKCGGLVVGLGKEFGITEWGAKVGIVDYSVKSQDAFGNYTITPRAFSKKADFTVQVPTGNVDFVQNLLAQYRATPIVYVGSNEGSTQYNSTIVYGFYKDFQLEIAYNAFSVCTLTVEGLT